MTLRIKSYPNMDTISQHDIGGIVALLEEISDNNGIGHETNGCVIGQKDDCPEDGEKKNCRK